MLILTEQGLYCAAGNFYIDPKQAVENAIITHAHSDHARRGSKHYYCTTSGADLLKVRLGKNITLQTYAYGEKFFLNDVAISFHPAGHILGSAQVRIEYLGQVWVVSGDYKRDKDPTCEPFESVACDVFVTEATFGTPAFQWNKNSNFAEAIHTWWNNNAKKNYNSLIFAYSLGKAQRILGELAERAQQPIYCHPAIEALNECYRNQQIKLAPTICLSQLPENKILENALIVSPSSILKTEFSKLLGKRYKTAFASGWVAGNAQYRRGGFVMSDHADWPDLLQTIEQTGAKRVYVQHRSGALVRELKRKGIKAYGEKALVPKNPAQFCMF